jgi:hypothetical protein
MQNLCLMAIALHISSNTRFLNSDPLSEIRVLGRITGATTELKASGAAVTGYDHVGLGSGLPRAL